MPFLATWIVILSKPETKKTLYDTAYMWGLLKGSTNKHSYKTEATDVENKYGYQWINVGGGRYWETGTDIDTAQLLSHVCHV